VFVAHDLPDNIRFADRASMELKEQIDGYIAREGIDTPIPHSVTIDTADEPCADPDGFSPPAMLELDAAGIRSVVWCTGFTPSFDWLHLPARDALGIPLYDQGMSPIPRLAFIGFPWLRRRASGIVYGIDADARYIVDHLLAAA
jgi:putative flavoprotein involved in K+ transport